MVNHSRKSGLSSESSADSQTNGRSVNSRTKPRKSRSISPNTEVKDILLNMREESSKSKMRQFKLNNVRFRLATFKSLERSRFFCRHEDTHDDIKFSNVRQITGS